MMETTTKQPQFVLEKHYRQESIINCLKVEHTHWHKPSGELVSLLQVDLFVASINDTPQRTCISSWGITPGQLRDLAACMQAAASDLEAHIQQLGQQEGGA